MGFYKTICAIINHYITIIVICIDLMWLQQHVALVRLFPVVEVLHLSLALVSLVRSNNDDVIPWGCWELHGLFYMLRRSSQKDSQHIVLYK